LFADPSLALRENLPAIMTHQLDVNRPMSLQQWGLLLAIGAVWGGAFFFVAVAIRDLPPLAIGAIRMSVAAAVLLSLLYLSGGRLPLQPRILGWFALLAFINSLAPLFLLAWAQQSITGGHNAILNATGPFMTLFVAHFLTQEEKLDSRRALGTLTGFAGVALMVGWDAVKGIDKTVLAQLAALLATMCFAFGTVAGRRFRHFGVPPLAATAGTMLFAALMFTPLSLIFDQPWTLPAPGFNAVAAAVAAGIVSTALGHYLFFRLLSTAGANNVALVSLLTPVSAILLGAFLLGEQVQPRHLAGMAIIAAGLIFVDGRWLRTLRRVLLRR
jgi:drug/metabolite transporter (DMT)-like permease